ncbi:hypothetical protein [Winogradskyella sp. SYSU M77433]|uniref:hypothetical protein n=1 Tax=Winogradskyella sp. SYSU M77433 TaxID=3042722 RepID=UPI0024810D7E|nr:hypothetical protein [Winogradskyella sp. SYSU M77433]MDH7911157.1 hypothetical protein [Winogradskyella sp. SYSU M77433]
MKKISLIKLAGILLLTFGITDLDFDNLLISTNYKAYISMIIGLIIVIISFFMPQKLKD